MILLIGPENWVRMMKHKLTDRTATEKLTNVRVAIRPDDLRGVREHIEVVACIGPGFAWSTRDEQMVAMAEHINQLVDGDHRG